MRPAVGPRDRGEIYINGTWQPSTARPAIILVNPATAEPFATDPSGTGADVDAAAVAASKALPHWGGRRP